MDVGTVRYYLAILERVRKGRAPSDETTLCKEIIAFDSVYTMSLWHSRKKSGVYDKDLEIMWNDKMLLDCGKLTSLLAQSLVENSEWNEIKSIYEPYVLRKIENFAKRDVDVDDLTGGFAFSEYVSFKEMLYNTIRFKNALVNSSGGKLERLLAETVLNLAPLKDGVLI